MGERLTIGFGDASAGLHGVAIAGLGTLVTAGGRVLPAGQPALRELDGVTRLGGDGLDVSLEPLGAPGSLGASTEVWLCRARGTVAGTPLDGLGTITRATLPDALALDRSVSAWFEPGLAFALAARRARGAGGHGDEELAAVVLRGEPPAAAPVAEPRLSTTYDGDGRIVHCGIELWETEDSEFAERIGGESVAHGELAGPGGALTAVTFMAFHRDGAAGCGHYAVTTAA